MTRLGVSLAIVLSSLLILVEPASGGVNSRRRPRARSRSKPSRSSSRSGYSRSRYSGSRYSGSRYSGSRYSGSRYSGSYRSSSYYRSPIVRRSYSPSYYTTSPSGSHYGSIRRGSSSCGSCSGSCRCCGYGASGYYRISPTAYYRPFSGYGISGTIIRYIIIR